MGIWNVIFVKKAILKIDKNGLLTCDFLWKGDFGIVIFVKIYDFGNVNFLKYVILKMWIS